MSMLFSEYSFQFFAELQIVLNATNLSLLRYTEIKS